MTKEYLVLDLETNSQKVFKRPGSPWFNSIVAIGMKTKDEIYSHYVYPDDAVDLKLDGIDILVGHNIKFDLLHIWTMPSLQEFFKRGGEIWDTQYAEYTLSMQQHKYPALRDLAPKYGCPVRPKYIEDLFFNKLEPNDYQDICDLPKELVLKDVEADVSDTETIYLKQIERAGRLGMYDLLRLEMDAILATTEMEYNGMAVNRETLKRNRQMLEEELKAEQLKLEEYIKKYWG